MDLDPAHLRSLAAIVRLGGFHRAAAALHLTQPAVSRHIRRLEGGRGAPLFERRGRGVELTAFGERAAAELADVLAAHDRAVARLRHNAPGAGRAFVLGTIENVTDPVLPELLAATRAALGAVEVQLRIDRSLELVGALAAAELDAAIVADPGDAPDAAEIGALTLRWWAAPERAAMGPDAGDPVPVVAYAPPCRLRDVALRRLDELGFEPRITAESPHLSGVHAAVRHGFGFALLAAGADGLRPVAAGPLAAAVPAPLWLVTAPAHRDLAAPLRAAVQRATGRRALAAAA